MAIRRPIPFAWLADRLFRDNSRPVAAMSQAGLSAEEAARRLAIDGPNSLPQGGVRTIWRIISEVMREPMLALLLAGGLAYLLLGDLTEALILLAFASFSVVVTIMQESRTEHVLEALRDLSAPRALVMRDGKQMRVAGCEVVRGDIMLLEQGDRIAADAVLLEANDLQADESLLTGESLPVGKRATADGEDIATLRPGGEGQPLVYSGSMATRGNGIAHVIATGVATQIGQIGKSLATLDTEVPRLRLETARIVRLCAVGGALVALTVGVLYGLTRGGWLDALLAGIAIGMSMLPEEFPVVLTIFLAVGAWRISKARVLTRRAAAIETLGSTTVLCTDKTGTLTENRMAVAQLWLPVEGAIEIAADRAVSDNYATLIETGIFASAVVAIDPMEVAIHEAGRSWALPAASEWKFVHSYGLRPDLLAMSNVWKTPEKLVVTAKGAPEAIATLCRLDPEQSKEMMRAADAMAELGIRVLGVAVADTTNPQPAESHRDYHFSLIGLIGLADPLRASVPTAVEECRAAGVRVMMITGDYAKTARSIALQAGLADGDVLTGTELEALNDTQLAERLQLVTICARIMPEQKLRIVEALKSAGEIVAMTGDGVNDAPSLKAAHIGIAMGKRGTDVAREASAIVLLDDDFGSIVKAIALGRRIYDNIRKAMAFIFAVHVPIAGFALIPLLLGTPILFGPIHIALLEMVIDPVCAFVFEAEEAEPDSMQRPPRPPAERLFSWGMIGWSVFQGGLAFALLTGVYAVAMIQGLDVEHVRTLLFFALISAIVALVLADRSASMSIAVNLRRKNSALAVVLASMVTISAAIMLIPGISKLLRFSTLNWQDWAVTLCVGMLLLLLFQSMKTVSFCRVTFPTHRSL
ncbi:MAG: cation-translocating P-type ATPase [Sphingomonadaceae bacterium]|jgi:Ca2+-transporting ATPase